MNKSKARAGELTRVAASPDQLRCWDCLSSVVGGDHHLRPVGACGFGIRASLAGGAATFDGDLMTRLVLAAHRDAVRIEVVSWGPHRIGVVAHPRRHGEGHQFERHPSLTDLAWTCVTRIDDVAQLELLLDVVKERIEKSKAKEQGVKS